MRQTSSLAATALAAGLALGLAAPAWVKNAKLIAWVADMVALCKPAAVHWCDGSETEYQQLCQRLNLPGLVYSRQGYGQSDQRPDVRGERHRQQHRLVLLLLCLHVLIDGFVAALGRHQPGEARVGDQRDMVTVP